MYEFRKASNDFKFQMEEELRNAEAADRQKKDEEERQRQLAANPPAQLEAAVPPASETPAAETTSSQRQQLQSDYRGVPENRGALSQHPAALDRRTGARYLGCKPNN